MSQNMRARFSGTSSNRGEDETVSNFIITKGENVMQRMPRKIHPPKPPKPVDRMQNMKTICPIGKTKWVKAHWRWNYGDSHWEWIEGHWSK